MENYRDEIYSERVRCGKRTYFIDVKPTQSGHDFFITISESRKVGERYEKQKIYLYKEDFSKFSEALERSITVVAKSLDQISNNGDAQEAEPDAIFADEPSGKNISVPIDEFRDLTVDDRDNF